jgi:2-keto-4-pentenoate hydratase
VNAGLDTQKLAERFVTARRTGVPIPVLHNDVQLTDAEAYKVQHRFVEDWCALQGTRVRGYKASITSAAAQAGLGTHEPTYGTLFDETIVPDGSQIKLGEFFSPLLLEVEIVFLIDADLPANATRHDVLAMSRIAAGIEIPESRYEMWWRGAQLEVMDFIADDSVAGRLIVGTPVPPGDLDLTAIEAQLTGDGEEVATGNASNVMGDPAMPVVWLSSKLASQGRKLPAGSVVTTGTFTTPMVAEPGVYEAHLLGVGSVRATFVP